MPHVAYRFTFVFPFAGSQFISFISPPFTSTVHAHIFTSDTNAILARMKFKSFCMRYDTAPLYRSNIAFLYRKR